MRSTLIFNKRKEEDILNVSLSVEFANALNKISDFIDRHAAEIKTYSLMLILQLLLAINCISRP
jgi:hypothetical protein